MAKTGKDKTISIRLSQLMLEALDARAVLDEKDRTQVIRQAISEYLDLPEESVEDKLVVLERKQKSLDTLLSKLRQQLQCETQRTDALEIRMEELSRIMSTFLEHIK
ncbi:MAG: ribbon-helix-helix protein, CopG family [Moorea sp. SIO4E2]|uniref:ribbon-helix-helix protein, CopG family n=1 Tax=Moorena sp. SIO4E2 TaxID=2607826 RepID=UPI0013BB76F8|nr:ribbon-helix-helix protein, CopG family [Moorena sp. SIO4E2]NEQ11905.1 ribbon-helix-helix protein, CopG family [Moorena sp. SIO4E2]